MGPKILLSKHDGKAQHYMAALAAGAIPTEQYCPWPDLSYDALVLAGGGDMEPGYYGEENTGCTDMDPARDRAELALFHAFFDAGKPILAICRGHQLVNVALGGSLVQDMGPRLCQTHSSTGLDRDRVHPIENRPGSFLHSLWGERCMVNSTHHQALGRVGRGLRVIARSPEGVAEACVHEEKPLFTLQFHPERMTGQLLRPDTVDGAALFTYFVEICKEHCHGSFS